jgi:Dolichyl-phosphate-mannose-protein mannosyltransferase
LHRPLNIRTSRVVLLVLVSFYLLNGFLYLRSQSLTSDEASFFDYAKRYAQGRPERIDPRTDNSKMPVAVLNILPRAFEQLIHPSLKKSDEGMSDIMMGRVVTLIVSVITLLIVYTWASTLHGKNAAVFAVFLCCFSPDLIASSGLVTTDAYSALFLLATMYLLWRFCRDRKLKDFIWLSLIVALSQLVKQSLFHLYVLVPLCLLAFSFLEQIRFNRKTVWIYAGLFAGINIIIINAGYFFSGTGAGLGSYHFTSDLFLTVQTLLPRWLPVPLPQPFVTGLDMAKYYDQIGGGIDGVSSFGKVTILGNASTGGAFWYYYFVSLFFKTPVPALILIVWALISLRKNRQTHNLFLLLPVLYFLFVMSFAYKTQCGMRHLIFIFPLLFIFCASVFRDVNKWILAVLSCWLVISVMQYRRNYYPYTNEFIFNKMNAYRYVGASNLEFQQGAFFARGYISRHPQVHFAPRHPEPGTFLINTADYLDIWNRHRYDWISSIPPTGLVAYNWLVIRVPQTDSLRHD